MLASPAFVHDTLTDVMTKGAVVVDKRKLLYALGAKQDRQSAWKRLLDAWEELDMARTALRGMDVWGATIVLTTNDDPKATPVFDAVTAWE